ncbi:MAG: hypothetical protein RMJ33_05565 [Saprospiraceae bacterium]|nr:T9SS type A sorting domain-containing protein [Saprospiraceae bacterium]MDW8229287.1 hypothetical protein [Saprospiraceae bacterium]
MKYRNFGKWRLVLGLVCLVTGAPAQTFWTETFDDSFQATSHWAHGGVNAGPSQWVWTSNPADGYQEPGVAPFGAPTAAKGYFLFNSDANGPTPHDVWLTNINRPADCQGRVGVRLRFYTQYIYFSPAGTRAQVGVSTNGNTFEYQTLFEGHPANLPFEGWIELDLPEANDQPQVWLRFRWIGNYEYHWKIDDLALFTVLAQNPDSCQTAVNISNLFGQTPGIAQTSPIFDNTNASVSATDPEISCWTETPPNEPDFLDNTLWFTFTGDGHRYDIQTVPCNAQKYVGIAQDLPGDTQMALFEGENCSNLTLVACNDDRSPVGDPDWRAGFVAHTEPGQRYYLMVDGYRGPNGPAQGEFCVQVTRLREVPCAKGAAGNVFIGRDGLVCFQSFLRDYLRLDTASFSLPTEGEVYGLAWCLSAQPIPDTVWPGNIPGVVSTVFSPTLTVPGLRNNGSFLPFGIYYLTPVVLGGGVPISPGPAFVFNVRPDSSGCFYVGASRRIVLLPPLEPLGATLQVTNETVPPGQNGAIQVVATGGSGQYLNSSALYEYYWSHGPKTPIITQLSQGTYTVSIADRSACLPGIVRTATVQRTVSAEEPTGSFPVEVFPSPAYSDISIQAVLPAVSEMWIELLSPLGQVLQSRRAYAAPQLHERVDVSLLPSGLYVLRLRAGHVQAVRRIHVERP